MADFNYAKDKVLMGAERSSMVMSDKESATPPTMRGATRSSPPSRSMPTRSTRSRSSRAAARSASRSSFPSGQVLHRRSTSRPVSP